MEIKPCPFCGSKSTGIRMHPDKQRREAVFCDNCSAVGPASSSQDNAIVAWNKGTKKC
jgi:Lar family restriction alleviation protein